MPSNEETKALQQLLTSFMENKKIIHLYVKKALAKPYKITVLERFIELFIVGFLVNLLSNLVFQFNPQAFIIVLALLSVSLTVLFFIRLKY